MNTYKERVKLLSERIVDAQRPIRILDAIKWGPEVAEFLLKTNFKELPEIGPETYAKQSLGYDPRAKKNEFEEIKKSIVRDLGESDPVGQLLTKMADQYRDVVEMVEARGTKRFWELSTKLYGSPRDHFYQDTNTILDLGMLLYSILSKIEDEKIGQFKEDIEAKEVVRDLNERFEKYFGPDLVKAKISDGIVADAAAGGDTVKIREGSMFSKREVDILEVHEGWVHIGTTQNGLRQHVAKWLSKGSPRCSATQEGLAVIMEIFTFRTFPKRARHINDRIIGIAKVEDGANLLELIEFYRTEGYSEHDCIVNAQRVFRGGVLTGGAPFTKDISYCRGFIENYNFIRSAIRAGKPEIVPYLFCGKMHVDDVPLLVEKHKEGIIDPPTFLPPHFKDLSGLTVWMSFSNFFNMVDLRSVQEHYRKLFEKHL